MWGSHLSDTSMKEKMCRSPASRIQWGHTHEERKWRNCELMIRKCFCALNLFLSQTLARMHAYVDTSEHRGKRQEALDWWRCSSGMHSNITPLIFASSFPPLTHDNAHTHKQTHHLGFHSSRPTVSVHPLLFVWQIDTAAGLSLLSTSALSIINPSWNLHNPVVQFLSSIQFIIKYIFNRILNHLFFARFSRLTFSSWRFWRASPHRGPFPKRHKSLTTSPPSNWRSAPTGRTGWSTGTAKTTR